MDDMRTAYISSGLGVGVKMILKWILKEGDTRV
jgi:hypothetical protein